MTTWKIGCRNCKSLFESSAGKIGHYKSEECPECSNCGPHLVGTKTGLELLGYKEYSQWNFQPQKGGDLP